MDAKELLAKLNLVSVDPQLRATLENRLIAFDKFEADRQALATKKRDRRAARKSNPTTI